MKKSTLLFIDGIINICLGLLLIIYPSGLVNYLGLPVTSNLFFQQILGAVFVGISIALFYEYVFYEVKKGGLGLKGAAFINICGGIMLLIWLIRGALDLTTAGLVFLWSLGLVLIMLSSVELYRGQVEN